MPKSTTQQLARARRLRLTLFASLGVLPLACGGTVTSHDTGDGDSAGTGSGGSSSVGGHHATAGTTSIAGDFPTTGGSFTAGGNGTAGTGVVTGGAGGAGGAAGKIVCTSSKRDPATGLVICAEGYTHRPVAITCGSYDGTPTEGGSGGADSSTLPRVTGYVPCEGDPTACAPFQYGYCASGQGGPICASGCATDQDCGPGAICLCTDPASPSGGSCIGSSCGTDEDCQPGYTCASYSAGCGGGYACQTPKDACKGQADCKAFEVCEPQEDGHRACMGAAVCGRPFLVAAEARVAPVVASGAWHDRAQTSPRVDHLTSLERAALAEHWTRMGQMEHASIAAFARFSLQLLALGAPPELVEACTRALGDETAHTKLCFELASAYAGRAIGPGPLDVRQSLDLTALQDIVELVIAEGCLGETGAALDALDAAERASDPVIRRAYSRIAGDEARHAELAFQFVRWALGQNTPAVRERVASVAAAMRGAASAAARQVTLPCLEALLA